jgi:hypothetical protein
MKNKVVFGIVLLSILVLAAHAEVVRATDDAEYPGADAYVTNDSTQSPTANFGTVVSMRWRQLADTRSKVAYIRFNITDVAGDMSGAYMTLAYTFMKGTGAATINVYGVIDGDDDFWVESGEGGINYNNAPGLAPASLGNYAINNAKATLLGTLSSLPAATLPVSVSTDPATLDLTEFLNADTNGLVTFFLIGPNDEDEIATKENTTYDAPKLVMPNASLGGALDPQPEDTANINRNTLTELSWTLIPEVVKCEVYFGTEPNIANPLTMDKLVFDPAVESVAIDAFAHFSTPLPEGTYYWRVDGYDGDTEPNYYEGLYWSFTATSAPVFVSITPTAQGKFEGENGNAITVTFESSSPLSYAWYRSTDNANNTDDDDVAVGDDSATLTLTGLDSADEGWYYCKASNPGETRSATARVTIKRLIAHWAFEGNADDETGVYDGTLMAEPNFVFPAGIIGQAAVFDGANYIDLPDGFSDFSAGITISVWAKPSTATNWARFVDLGNGASSDNIYLSRNGTSTSLSFSFYRGSTSAGIVTATNALVLDEWQMFVAVLDEAGNATLYKNGLAIQTGSFTQMPNILVRTSNFIGESNWTDDAFYNGAMDDLHIYSYALDSDTLADMYSGAAGPYCRTRPALDWNGNCVVDLADFVDFSSAWLNCGLWPVSACDDL